MRDSGSDISTTIASDHQATTSENPSVEPVEPRELQSPSEDSYSFLMPYSSIDALYDAFQKRKRVFLSFNQLHAPNLNGYIRSESAFASKPDTHLDIELLCTQQGIDIISSCQPLPNGQTPYMPIPIAHSEYDMLAVLVKDESGKKAIGIEIIGMRRSPGFYHRFHTL